MQNKLNTSITIKIKLRHNHIKPIIIQHNHIKIILLLRVAIYRDKT